MDTTTNAEEIDKALKFDSLAAAERVTGKSYKSDSATSALGMMLSIGHSASLRSALAKSGDTTMSMDHSEYVSIIEGAGFVKGYEKSFGSTRKCIYTLGGFVLFFDTYTWSDTTSETINSGKLYYNVSYQESMRSSIGRVMSSGHNISGDNGERVLIGDHDCRQAVLHNIEKLQEVGVVLDKWVETPFLWFLHHSETKVDDYDYDAITREVLAECSQGVRDIIGVIG